MTTGSPKPVPWPVQNGREFRFVHVEPPFVEYEPPE
jgi:hypothetical protein